ncbi:TPA: hypothetical protein HA338_11910 [Methanosarcina acetivorans]|uniref:Uncharacterized protein n=1 Tax=Methanosarcina acetivorans TaxID=2214 RepID=A0A832WAX9_9EURY|nr:hypothetical protein [Methanosarcina acetivorans]HIH94685.1 hypothetical protein [Methanosarcina acetivorans]
MIDLFTLKMPVFRKRAKFITKDNDRKSILPNHFVEVNGVKGKTDIAWKRYILL